MRKLLGALLLVLFFLTGCGAASKSADRAEVCEANMAADIDADGAMYSMERSLEDGTEITVETPLICVSFSQHSDTLVAEDGTKLFTASYYVPEFMTDDAEKDLWLASCVNDAVDATLTDLTWTRNLARDEYPGREEGMFYAYSYYSNVNTERMDNEIVSVLQVNSTYSGGAHPNYAQLAYNLDIEASRQLGLADVIEPGGEERLLERVLEELQIRFGDFETLGLFPDYRQVVEDCFDGPELTNQWYFGDNGLNIYFNCYEIAPYAAGIINVELDYDELTGVLRPDYFPGSAGAGEGSAILLNSPEGRRTLPVPSEGEVFYIGTDRVIYDVKIQRVTGWLADDMPIIGAMVFAANRLTREEAIVLGDGGISGDAMYIVSYKDGTGLRRTVAVGPGIIREIIAKTAE